MRHRGGNQRAVRRATLGRVGVRALQVALIGAAWTGGMWALPRAAAVVRDHPYFAVTQIALRGAAGLDREVVLGAANLRSGMSVWAVSPALARENIEALAGVRRARVWREFPDRVVVQVSVRSPMAIAVFDGLHFLDRSGHLLGPVRAGDSMNLPFVTGMSAEHVDGAGLPVLRRALRLVRLCEQQKCGGGVSEVHIDPAQGLVLIPRRTPVPILVGWGAWRHKLERLERILAAWEGQAFRLATIDVTFPRAVVVKLREGPARSRGAGSRSGMSI